MNKLQIIIGSGLAILLGILVIQNRAPVETRLLFTTMVMPQAILLFLAAAVGFTLGVLLALHVGAKIRKKQ